jgi:hypothetical protein
MSRLSQKLSHLDRDKLAAVLSVIPGLGHLLKRQRKIGWGILIFGNLFVAFLTLTLAEMTSDLSFYVVPPAWMAGVAISAHSIRDRSGHRPPPFMVNGSDKRFF